MASLFKTSDRSVISSSNWRILSPCSRIRQLSNNLASIWSDRTKTVWPKVESQFVSHLTSPPRIHRETQQRKDGLYEEVLFIRWVWDFKEYFWAYTIDEEDDDSGYLASPDDIKNKPDPSFYDTENYPMVCNTDRWKDLPTSPWDTIGEFVEILRDFQKIRHFEELDDDNVISVIALNVCNALAKMTWKRRIFDLDEAEKVLDEIPVQYWPLFLCWGDRQLYTV